jgi:protein-arginine kinase activator protein McsA
MAPRTPYTSAQNAIEHCNFQQFPYLQSATTPFNIMAHAIAQHVLLHNGVFYGLAFQTFLAIPQIAEYLKPQPLPVYSAEQLHAAAGELAANIGQTQPATITITNSGGTPTASDIVTSTLISTVTIPSVSTVTKTLKIHHTIMSAVTVPFVSTVTQPFTINVSPGTYTTTSFQTSTVIATETSVVTETILSDVTPPPKVKLSGFEWFIGLTLMFSTFSAFSLAYRNWKRTRVGWYIEQVQETNEVARQRNEAIRKEQDLERDIAEIKKTNGSTEANMLKAYETERNELRATIRKQSTRWERFAKTVEELDGFKMELEWFEQENWLEKVVDTFKVIRNGVNYQRHWGKAQDLDRKLTTAEEKIEYLERRNKALETTINECTKDADAAIRDQLYKLREQNEADQADISSLRSRLQAANGFTGLAH